MLKLIAVSLCLALVLPSCAEDKALLVSGEALVALADQFTATAAAMDVAVDSKAIDRTTYRKWRVFGRKFQTAYPAARKLWEVALETNDDRLRAQAVAVVSQLQVDLAAHAALAGVK